MTQNFYYVLLYIFLFLLDASMLLSRPIMPKITQNSGSLSYLQNLIGVHKGNKTKGIFELKKYLSNFGYIKMTNDNFERPNNQVSNENLFDDNLELAVKRFQQFFKLNISGILDSQTISQLQLPRCGVPDLVSHDIPKTNSTNLKIGSLYNFFPGAPKWWTLDLTYSFEPGTRGDVMTPIADALAEWSRGTGNSFKFTRIPNYDQANIKISFQVWNHGDGSNFDGPGHVLAHAFAPNDGRLHYDGSEDWVDGTFPNKYDLKTIGLHELGHVLGLQHSDDQSSIMWPYMKSGLRKGLSQDDMIGINLLYNLGKHI